VTDIFLSYARVDAARAGELAGALEDRGFTVFWDTEVLPGQRWRDVIHGELAGASCVIVLWSEASSGSRWVVEEASEALDAGKLLPVLLDDTLPPFGFRAVEGAKLNRWRPGTLDTEFENLVHAVRGILGEPASEVEGPTEAAPPVVEEGTVGDAEAAPPVVEEGTVGDAEAAPPLVEEGTVGDAERAEAGGAVAPPVVEGHTDTPSRTPGPLARLGPRRLAAIGVGAVLVVVLVATLGGGGDGDDGEALDADALLDPARRLGALSPTTAAAGGDTEATPIVEDDTLVVFRAATAPEIDGDLADWASVPERYRLSEVVFRDQDVTDRLGADSPGVVALEYDEEALYLAVVSEDDVYSQANTGNQIWRGDALDINLTTAGTDQVSGRPDGDDFQLTMTPQDADGATAAVWFTGNGNSFADNTTDLRVSLAGAVSADGSWVLEAAIAWSVFGLDGPPPGDIAALVAVFDSDGEEVDGAPRQTVILGHTGAEFQRPQTWGTLTFQRP